MTILLSSKPDCYSDDYSVEEYYSRGMNLLITLNNLFMLMTHRFTSPPLFCSTAYLTSLLRCLQAKQT